MKWYAWLIVAAISLPNLACMHAEFFTGARAGKTKTLNNPFFLFGLVGENTFDTSKYCPRGVAAVDSYESFGDGFLSVGVPTSALGKIVNGQGQALVSNKGKIRADGGTVFRNYGDRLEFIHTYFSSSYLKAFPSGKLCVLA